jgi:hypothetical protein
MHKTIRALAVAALATLSASSFAQLQAEYTWTGTLAGTTLTYFPGNGVAGGAALYLGGTKIPCDLATSRKSFLVGGSDGMDVAVGDAYRVLADAKAQGATVTVVYTKSNLLCQVVSITR